MYIRIQVKINNYKVIVIVDSGATENFKVKTTAKAIEVN